MKNTSYKNKQFVLLGMTFFKRGWHCRMFQGGTRAEHSDTGAWR